MRGINIFVFSLAIAFLLVPLSFSLQGDSDRYSTETKLDSFASSNSASINFVQRVIGGIALVGRYNSSSFTGRFGILVDDMLVCTGDFGEWSEWSICVNNAQTRIRYDSTSCSDIETRYCTIDNGDDGGGGGGGGLCTPRWTAWSEWSDCNATGFMERTRNNGCGIIEKEVQRCGCETLWKCSAISTCTNNLQEIKCIDLNQCEEDYSFFTKCIPQINITYTPKNLFLYVHNDSIIEFNISAISGISEGTLSLIWKLDGGVIKSSYGADYIKDTISRGFDKNSELIAEFYFEVDNFSLTQSVKWNIFIVDSDCIEDWYCRWTPCNEEGIKYSFDCIDRNLCKTTINLPYEKICECFPDFKCAEWSDCNPNYKLIDILNGKISYDFSKKRLCEDNVGCESTFIESKNCVIKVPVRATISEWCFEEYIELREIPSNNLVSRMKKYSEGSLAEFSIIQNQSSDIINFEISGGKKVDVNLVIGEFEGFCAYCYDGVKNYDEEEVDCGGSNCPPCDNMISYMYYISYLFYAKLFLWLLLLLLLLLFIYSERENISKGYGYFLHTDSLIKNFIESSNQAITEKIYSLFRRNNLYKQNITQPIQKKNKSYGPFKN
jgi:hypothetical protein